MRRVLVLPVIAGLLLALAGCGADDAPSATASGEPTSSTASSSTTTTTTTEATTSTPVDADDPESVDDAPVSPVLGTGCGEIGLLWITALNATAMAFTPSADTTAIDDLRAELERADVPVDVKEAFEVWLGAWSSFAAEAEGLGEDMLDPANAEKLQEIGETMKSPEVQAATATIDEYFETC